MFNPVATRCIERIARVLLNHAAIFGMYTLPEQGVACLDLAGLVAQDPIGLVGPTHIVVVGVPFPAANARQSFRVVVCDLGTADVAQRLCKREMMPDAGDQPCTRARQHDEIRSANVLRRITDVCIFSVE